MKRLWRLMTSLFVRSPPTASGPSAAKDVEGGEGWLEGRTYHSFGNVYELTIPDLPAFAKFTLNEAVDALAAHDAGGATCESERWRLQAVLDRVDAKLAELTALRERIVEAQDDCARGACRVMNAG